MSRIRYLANLFDDNEKNDLKMIDLKKIKGKQKKIVLEKKESTIRYDYMNLYNKYKDKNRNTLEEKKGLELPENVGNSNNNIIQKLLNQMDFLTKGQNSLEKMFNNIQLDTQEQIDNLNINYENLQIKTNKLNKDFDNFNLNVY